MMNIWIKALGITVAIVAITALWVWAIMLKSMPDWYYAVMLAPIIILPIYVFIVTTIINHSKNN